MADTPAWIDQGQFRRNWHVDEFVWQGTWWLPESKHHRVTGSLEYNDDGIELATLGSWAQAVVATPGFTWGGARTLVKPGVATTLEPKYHKR